MSDQVFNNGLLEDAAFRDTLFSMFPEMRDWNWQEHNTVTEILPPFNNSSIEIPPINDTHSQTDHHFHHNPNSQVLPINDTHSQTNHHFHHNPNNQVFPTLPPKVEHDSVPPKYRALSSASKQWTLEEHRLFLEGLEKYGKGKLKSISRHVKTRTPAQVASHSQKYFLRQSALNKKKRRSIHDIDL